MACNEQEEFWDGEGTLKLSVNMQSNVSTAKTRAELTPNEQEALLENCRIRIYNGGGTLIRKYQGWNTLPSELKLSSGDYRVRITAGDSVAASFSSKYYDGSKTFTVKKGAITPVSVNCNISNTLATVVFDPTLDEAFESYNVKVLTTKGNLEFTSQNVGATGYYMLPSDKMLLWTFTGVSHAGSSYTKSDTINDAKASTRYDFTFKYNSTPTVNGGGSLEIEVDESAIEVTDSIVIYQSPVITALDASNNPISLDNPLFLEENSGESLSLWVVSSCPLTNVDLSCDAFTSWGLDYNSYGLLSKETNEYLAGKGVTIRERNSLNGATIGVVFSQEFIQNVTKTEGTYIITLYAKDNPPIGGYVNETTKSLVITVSNATIITVDVVDSDVWTSKATLRARAVKEPENAVSFKYRKRGTTDVWTTISAILDGEFYTADISGLEANTRYEYAAADGEKASSVVCSFITEAKRQLENAGFEYWSQPDKPILLYGTGQSPWWDSGNHGSSTMSKNVTQSATDYVHSGSYSAKLQSQFVGISVIGKFAAGNAFVGQYLETDGTDGILGLGRPFTSRPKSLKGYIRYQPGEVKYADVPSDVANFPKGSTDIGSIYIAIGDWEGEKYGGTTWPVIIKTKSSELQLFDPKGKGVIAYGVQDWIAATAGNGMIEFEIPLEYYSGRKPNALLIVCSASKYGDYFSGGDSTMWIDDLELIYE